jgi:hypothetical protein
MVQRVISEISATMKKQFCDSSSYAFLQKTDKTIELKDEVVY